MIHTLSSSSVLREGCVDGVGVPDLAGPQRCLKVVDRCVVLPFAEAPFWKALSPSHFLI